MSIRLRLTLWYTAILAGTLIIFGVILYFLLSTMTQNQYKEILEKHTEKVHDRIDFGLSLSMRGWDLDIQLDDVDTFLSKEIYLQVVNLTNIQDLSSIKVMRSSNAVDAQLQIPFTASTYDQSRAGEAFFETVKMKGYPFLTYNKPLVINDQLVGVLQASVITGENLNDLRNIFIIASIFTVLLAASFGWFLARKALKPIDHVIVAADKIEKGTDLDQRITYEGPNDEIGRLIRKINGMLSRIQTTYSELEEAYRAQRRFVSDASHELRTPLTTIRGNIDYIQKMLTQTNDIEQNRGEMEAIEDITEETERMSRLVNDLLSLARADAGYEMNKEVIKLRPLVEEVLRKSQFIPKKASLNIGSLDAFAGKRVYGNQDYLQQMLYIFIENAFKYTPEGRVEISVQTTEEQAGIRISDSGVGMEKDEIPQIFDRFYRADMSRGLTSGTGLGLSIAKWIIDEHQGSVEVRTLKGEGTSFLIWLPLYFQDEGE